MANSVVSEDFETQKFLRSINKPCVNVEFSKLSCTIGKKKILKSISGKFCSGQLIGILGSSGAGKTTLLNVLTGHTECSTSGDFYINGEPRSMKKFRKIICYIKQEDLVQPFLTVGESVRMAALLKMKSRSSEQYIQSLISGLLSVIGLETSIDTQVEDLSGGQRKRLSIALELVSNPSLIFLDEPTTGLDDVAMRQCMKLLKSLSESGSTVICTIHQPSDSLFKLFDTVYFMSDGYCIYNGTVPNMIPFLSNAGFPCPTNYNPADYIIELAHGDEIKTNRLSDMIINGDCKSYLQNNNTPVSHSIKDTTISIKKAQSRQLRSVKYVATTFWIQFYVLTYRNYLQLRRNKIVLGLHFVHNIVCGLAIGLLFFQIGKSGSLVGLNTKCLFGVVIYFLFTHSMAPTLLYPSEVRLLEREHFNRWYSLKAYFAAYTVAYLPLIVIPTILFVAIIYTLTGQPMEVQRFCGFCLISVLTAITSQTYGFIVGALFNPIRGACVGSGVAMPLVLLAMHGIGYGDTLTASMRFLMSFSFPYQAFVGLTTSVLKDIGKIECDEIFCYFADSNFLLLKMGMHDKDYWYAALYLLVFFVLHRMLLYFILTLRMSSRGILLRTSKLFDLK